jgi:hypothetical protein
VIHGDDVHTPSNDLASDRPAANGRRSFLLGGGALAAAAFLAACGNKSSGSNAEPTTTTAPTAPADVAMLRGATSIALAAQAIYQAASDSKLVTDSDLQTVVSTFQGHHKQHAQLIGAATLTSGGQAETTPNPTLMAGATPRLQAAKAQGDIMSLLYDVERQAQASYQNASSSFQDGSLAETVMMAGGSVARHTAYLSQYAGKSMTPDGAFSSTAGAIPLGSA